MDSHDEDTREGCLAPTLFSANNVACPAPTRALMRTKKKGRESPPGPVDDCEETSPYSTFTFAISFPSGSRVWMAQARHGSKEWTVRRTSRGLSVSAIGFPIREAS